MFSFDAQYALFDATPVDNQFILEQMPLAKGDYVKVYLYGLVQCYHPQTGMSVTEIAQALSLPESEVLAAFRFWERRGLVVRLGDQPPRYQYISAKMRYLTGQDAPQDADYTQFSEMLYAVFGSERRLHGKDISLCYEWVEDMGFTREAVILVIQKMIEKKGKNVTMATIQKEITRLADEKSLDVDAVEGYFERDRRLHDGSKAILKRFGKRREPSEDEMQLYRSWTTELGYGHDAILEACAETTKGDPTFAYLDGILRGMLGRRGTAAKTAAEMSRASQLEKDESELVKRLLHELNVSGLTINEGTRAVYRELWAIYPDERIILMAGRECAKRAGESGGRMDDVLRLLTAWQKRGLDTPEQVAQYVETFNRQTQVLRDLYEGWGKGRGGVSQSDRDLLQKWETEWGFDEGFIRYAATLVGSRVEEPTRYMDKVLQDFLEKGIKTEAEAAAAHAAYMERYRQSQPDQPSQPAPRIEKVTNHQQYNQRSYADEPVTMPDWMRQMMEEEDAKAQQHLK